MRSALRLVTSLLVSAALLLGCASPSAAPAPVGPPPVPPVTSTPPPALRWSELPPIQPVAVAATFSVHDQRLQADPQHPSLLAWCGTDGIHASRDSGATWTTSSTAGMRAAIAPDLKPVGACFQVILDPKQAGTLYATAGAVPADMDPPPSFLVGFFSQDSGRTWQRLLPAHFGKPVGPSPFGGFRVAGDAVQALLSGTDLLQTTDGGATWTPGKLGCSGDSPCVLPGPAPAFYTSCAMHGQLQRILAGPGLAEVLRTNTCGPGSLLQLSPTSYLLLSSDTESPRLQRTDDAGQTWRAIDVPAVTSEPAPLRDLLLLPGGALLAHSLEDTHAWQLLAPKAAAWCTVTALPANATQPTAVADKLWYLTGNPTRDQQISARSVELASLHCPTN